MQELVLVFGQVTLHPTLSQYSLTIAGSGTGEEVSSDENITDKSTFYLSQLCFQEITC